MTPNDIPHSAENSTTQKIDLSGTARANDEILPGITLKQAGELRLHIHNLLHSVEFQRESRQSDLEQYVLDLLASKRADIDIAHRAIESLNAVCMANAQEIAALKACAIRPLVVSRVHEWMAEHMHPYQIAGDGSNGIFFYRAKHPQGITQEFPESFFNPGLHDEGRAAWDEIRMMINTLFDEGWGIVNVNSKKESSQ